VRKYFDFAIGGDTKISKELFEKPIKYKVIDLNLWKPGLEIPKEYLLPYTKNLRILHSAYLDKSDRTWQGRNIKGSPYVLAAIEQLKVEGHAIEYVYISDKPSNQMRFYQAQADIVVEQLIYGWWGSTGVETMALGKPVICYLRPSWRELFLNLHSEYEDIPIVQADTQTIYESLKNLVVDADYRKQKGKESRIFAEQHFNPVNNTKAFIHLLDKL
jgi:glycosyltransferase involved in cell wall biosynthesis